MNDSSERRWWDIRKDIGSFDLAHQQIMAAMRAHDYLIADRICTHLHRCSDRVTASQSLYSTGGTGAGSLLGASTVMGGGTAMGAASLDNTSVVTNTSSGSLIEISLPKIIKIKIWFIYFKW